MNRIIHAVKEFWVEEFAERPGKKTWFDRHIVAYRIVGICLVLAAYVYGVIWWFNTDIKELNHISEYSSQVEKEYLRRKELISNLTNIVRNYAKHEKILFKHVSDMRAQLQSLETLKGNPSAAQSAQVKNSFLKLVALAEQYPDLKAGQRFNDLMDMAEVSENRIVDTMDKYIEYAQEYNICHQCYWCNYFTYPVAAVIPLPAYWEYFHTEQEYKNAPLVAEDFLDGGK